MTSLHLTRGLPGSGKTTFAREWVEGSPNSRYRVNRDDLRFALFGKYWGVDENYVTIVQHAAIRGALSKGKNVIVDDTNLNSKNAKELLKIAAEVGAEVVWHDQFLDVPLQELIIRDAMRDKMVGQKVIEDFYQRYMQGGRKPKRPALTAEEVPLHEPYTGTPGKPEAFLVDIDGTIASNGESRDNPNRGYFDWARVGEDLPIQKVIDIVQNFEDAGLKAVFVSGRDAVCYPETYDWIEKHVGFLNDERRVLFMRPEGDTRKDSIVKLEIFDEHIRDNYDIQFCIDDRDQVVKAYRSIGLTVLQVAEGNF